MKHDTRKSVGVLGCKEHLIAGHVLTDMEAIVLFGVPWLRQIVSELRRDGWVIQRKRTTYLKAMTRLRTYISIEPPMNLPIKEIAMTEYWIEQ